MHRCIVVGSIRENGRCAHLAQDIFESCIEQYPDEGVSIVSVASLNVSPCIGCDACKQEKSAEDTPELPEDGDPLYPTDQVLESNSRSHVCVFEDDMREVRKHIDAADEIIVVCPLYFAGAPAQMKALLDRMQPYFWSNIRQSEYRRDLTVHVIGEDGNPYGFDALVTTLQSAFGVSAFQLTSIFDWRGKITADGQIIADPEEYYLAEDVQEDEAQGEVLNSEGIPEPANIDDFEPEPTRDNRSKNKQRPKLSLSEAGSNKKSEASKHGSKSTNTGKSKKSSNSNRNNSSNKGSNNKRNQTGSNRNSCRSRS